MSGLIIDNVGGCCPCQAEGFFDGNPFYFRARHGDWRLAVVGPGKDPVEAGWTDGAEAIYEAEGDDPDGGYMPAEEATRIITEHYNKWKAKA